MCSISDCERPFRSKNLCEIHYRRLLTHGDPLADVATKDGSGFVDLNGYRVLYRPGHPNATASGEIFEHRVVMVAMLGRPLRDDETVHHRNGQRADNRPENLELWSHSQPSGQRIPDKLAWAVEILEIYAPDLLASAASRV